MLIKPAKLRDLALADADACGADIPVRKIFDIYTSNRKGAPLTNTSKRCPLD
jgi:hypothetical protein